MAGADLDLVVQSLKGNTLWVFLVACVGQELLRDMIKLISATFRFGEGIAITKLGSCSPDQLHNVHAQARATLPNEMGQK